MTWTKIGDGFIDEPSILVLSRDARLLYIECLVWSNRHGTDGAIPSYVLRRITDADDPMSCVRALVDAGKWVETDDGWETVDFLKDQPSAADVARTQRFATERQRRQRQHRGGDHSLCDPRYCEKTRSDHVTRDITGDATSKPRVTNGPPSRPGPARPGPLGQWARVPETDRLLGQPTAPAKETRRAT